MSSVYKQIGIYRITNIKNGMTYVGKTGMNFGDRWDCHRAQLNGGYHHNSSLQSDWNKFGADNFEFKIIETVEDTSCLNDLETKYITMYREQGLNYNVSDGGDAPNLGKHLSDETKRKIGEKNRANMTGKKASDETKKKMSRSQKARYENWTQEDGERWGRMTSERASGYHLSDSFRKAMSERQKTKPNAARFTADDIRAIRSAKENGVSSKELAEKYATTPSYISLIVNRRRWAYI